jgi:molecular chaperone GrpE
MGNNQQDDQNQPEEITLEKLQTDFESAMSGWKRTAADFENYKRRKESENKELVEFAREVTVVKLLPTLDSLEQALRHMPQLADQRISESANQPDSESADQLIGRSADLPFAKKYQNWQTGVNGIIAQLDKTLEELGVKKIEALGKKFNPHLHEAVREVESEADDGIIVDELQTGFELNGKVIRPSQVVISKKKN